MPRWTPFNGRRCSSAAHLLSRWEQRLRLWLANALVALAFAVAHLDPGGSIRPAIVAHTLNNLVGVVSTALASSTAEAWSAGELVRGCALVLVGTAGVWRLTRPS